MNSYNLLTFIICLGALFAYINNKFIKWPSTIGIMVLSLCSSIIIVIAGNLFAARSNVLITGIASLDFHSLLMNSMLSFLLFAGAMQLDAKALKKERLSIISLATTGIFISTFLIGTLLYFLFHFFHSDVAYVYCLLFAALISPTDPIAVLAILKQAGLPKSLELKISGESLFNDGVAVVVFLTILSVAQLGIEKMSVTDVLILFLRDAGGGLIFGWALGYITFYALKSIDKYEVEVMITVATVMGGYLLAGLLHVSGPLAMVVAGIIVGSKSRESAESGVSNYVGKFWELIDEMLNMILFMLIGFEMLVVKTNTITIVIGIITIGIVLLSRWVSVFIPFLFLRSKVKFEQNAIAILTWGGLRGGLSVALALSLPANMHKDTFVSITYVVVIFSIIVQGLTIGRLYKRLSANNKH